MPPIALYSAILQPITTHHHPECKTADSTLQPDKTCRLANGSFRPHLGRSKITNDLPKAAFLATAADFAPGADCRLSDCEPSHVWWLFGLVRFPVCIQSTFSTSRSRCSYPI